MRSRTASARFARAALAASVAISAASCVAAASSSPRREAFTPAQRLEILRRAQVWSATDIPSMNLRLGPQELGAFAPDETVRCDYSDIQLGGHSPKFMCAVAPGDLVKVKYGRANGEVYGEVAATRLLWALGFGADRMYPVRVICRGCPARLHGAPAREADASEFEIAAIERRMPGRVVRLADREGWTWPELDLVSESAGGAPRSQRDALTLLAAIMQHTDSKSEQQRLLCFGATRKDDGGRCDWPWAIMDDVGLTFGRANMWNREDVGSVNLTVWTRTPVWLGSKGCVANISRSQTGTLDEPRISEEGRRFLAGLMSQLTDGQLHDLFETARFQLRSRDPASGTRTPGSVDEWVAAFKTKRDEVERRGCEN